MFFRTVGRWRTSLIMCVAVGVVGAALTGCDRPAPVSTVYVLLYGAGTNNEGIHSFRNEDGSNTILVFDGQADAARFANDLEQQDFPSPTVEAIRPEDMFYVCENEVYICKRVPLGSNIAPSLENVPQEDWDFQPPL